MLEGKQVSKYFGGLCAVKNVDFTVSQNEIVGLIGPNGAGKTTLFNCISGIYPPDSGEVIFNGKKITGLKPHQICALGIGRTFQIIRPFSNLTVLQNVMAGSVFGQGKVKSISEARNEVLELLEFVGLSEKKDYLAKHLTIPDLKKMEIARALAVKPKIILLDEFVAGLNPTETDQAIEIIKRIRDDYGIIVFWVEHVMKAVMNVADRIVVLHHGEKIADGTPKEITNDPEVVKAYLGEKYIF